MARHPQSLDWRQHSDKCLPPSISNVQEVVIMVSSKCDCAPSAETDQFDVLTENRHSLGCVVAQHLWWYQARTARTAVAGRRPWTAPPTAKRPPALAEP